MYERIGGGAGFAARFPFNFTMGKYGFCLQWGLFDPAIDIQMDVKST